MESTRASAQTRTGSAGNCRFVPPPPGSRSAEQIRNDIVRERQQLSRSVDALRTRWGRVTDVKSQVRAHRAELLVGAAVVGFLVGGAIALRARRR